MSFEDWSSKDLTKWLTSTCLREHSNFAELLRQVEDYDINGETLSKVAEIKDLLDLDIDNEIASLLLAELNDLKKKQPSLFPSDSKSESITQETKNDVDEQGDYNMDSNIKIYYFIKSCPTNEYELPFLVNKSIKVSELKALICKEQNLKNVVVLLTDKNNNLLGDKITLKQHLEDEKDEQEALNLCVTISKKSTMSNENENNEENEENEENEKNNKIKSQSNNDVKNMKKEYKNLGLIGLNNLGNSCFFNAAVQCMLQIPGLTEIFNEQISLHQQKYSQYYKYDPRYYYYYYQSNNNLKNDTVDGKVWNAWLSLINCVHNSEKTYISPDDLYHSLGEKNPKCVYISIKRKKKK